MAQRIITECDVHLNQHDESVEGTPRVVALNGKSERIVDLCDECAKEFIDPLADLLADSGRNRNSPPGLKRGPRSGKQLPTTTRTNTEGKPILPCPVEGCTTVTEYITRSSLRSHVRSIHDVELAVMEARNGRTVEGEEVTDQCPSCEAGFASPQGLGAHRSHAHGYGNRNK